MKRFFLTVSLLLCLPIYAQEYAPLKQEDIPEIMEALREMFIDRFCQELKKQYMSGKRLNSAFRNAKKAV